LTFDGDDFLGLDVREYANVPPIAIADPITVLRSIASLKTIAETTIIITLFAVFSTDEVTEPTCAVKAKAHSSVVKENKKGGN
jgi:hypothetical protein